MSPDAELVMRLIQAGATVEQVQVYLDAWARPVPSLSQTPGAIRQRRYMERKKAREQAENVATPSVTDDVIMTSLVTQKERSPTPPKEKLPPSSSLRSEEPPPGEFATDEEAALDCYNQLASQCGWTQAVKMTTKRRSALKQRISDAGGIEAFYDVMVRLAQCRHGREFGSGKNDRKWKIHIEYVLRPDKFAEIMEGRFDDERVQGRSWSNGSSSHSGSYG